jgi:multisubunit Na+/H+ antiporter MnhB subunit
MIVQFFIEISICILIFFILKKNWHNEKVRKHFIDFIIAINVFACILYLYISYFGMFTIQDAVAKIFLHGIVAIIIYTLTKNSFYEK